jgi:uncharacterized protein YraI
MTMWSQKPWLYKFMALIVMMIFASSLAVGCWLMTPTPNPTSTPILTPTPTPGSFSYPVRVEAKETGKDVRNAEVRIEVAGKADLCGVTDSNGVARIFIESSYAGQPGFLIVEATGYVRHEQHIDLIVGALPYVVQLEKSVMSTNPTPETPPIATVTPSTSVSPSSVLTITPSTPLTSTVTPSSTPSGTITSTPEAVVISATGLNLRSGPGTDYNPPIDYLGGGEILDVIGRIASKEWIKVVPVSRTNTISGWVSASTRYVQINIDLDTIPVVEPPPLPTAPSTGGINETAYQYQYGPKLYEPRPWVVYSVDDTVWFTWERFDLKPDQYYSVRVVLDIEPEAPACIHVQTQNPKEPTKNPEVFLKLDCPAGGYYWSVAVATKLPEGSEDEWREDSDQEHRHHFGIGIPHPNTPHELIGKDPGELPFDE